MESAIDTRFDQAALRVDDAPFRVVGLGASAGGLEPLLQFFSSAAVDEGIAYVVVQHLSPEHRSSMPELLARRTRLPIVTVDEAVTIAGDTIYLMPAQHDLIVSESMLRPQPRLAAPVPHLPIDSFFSSLAHEYGPHAVAIVLSGTGRDGAVGVRAVRDCGGLVLVQQPTTAEFDGMPSAAIATGAASMVLEAAAMPREIGRAHEGMLTSSSERELKSVFGLLAKSSGIDFSQYKLSTVARRLERRLNETGCANLGSYLDYLALHPAEASNLANDLMIGVTQFFRDPEVFARLAAELPALLQRIDAGAIVRVWCPGCSSGEEPYSIAMALHEACAQLGRVPRIKLFGTDVDARAIDRASHGVYPMSVAEQVGPARLERWFEACPEGMRVKKELRQSIVFTLHNALRDPPFSRLDLLSCRNLLIYLRPEAQRSLIARAMLALRPGGLLILGHSESAAEHSDGLEQVDARSRIYRRNAQKAPSDAFRSNSVLAGVAARGPSQEQQERRRVMDEAYRLLCEQSGSASFVLTASGTLFHSIGDVSQYVQLPSGPSSLDVVKLARGGLGSVIGAGISRALRTGAVAEYRGIEFRRDERASLVDVRVTPFHTNDRTRYLLVTLQPHQSLRHEAEVPEGESAHIALMQAELERTRGSLQTAIEEVESSNEELQATNEELLAANEEMQSTNEELQAANEELFTVNSEHEQRIQDLIEANADIDNLLSCSQIGILFLDEKLQLRRFTPKAAALLDLVERDLNRPIGHVASLLWGIDLQAVASDVFASGEMRDIPAEIGKSRFLVRVAPYSMGAETRGVVINLVDVSTLRGAQDDLEAVMNSLPEHVAVLGGDGTIRATNEAWRRFTSDTGFVGGSVVGDNYLAITERAAAAGDIAARSALQGLRAVLGGSSGGLQLEYQCKAQNEERAFFMQVRPLLHDQGAVISHVDITARLLAERSTRNSEAVFRRLFAFSREPLLLIDLETLSVMEASTATAELLECPPSSLLGICIADLLVPEGCTWFELAENFGNVSHPAGAVVEFAVAGASGVGRTVRTRILPIQGGSKRCLLLSLGERTESIRPSAANVAELNQSQKMEALGKLAGGVAHELNNVLAAILGVSFAWRADLPPDSQQAKDLDAILAACRRGGDLTRSLLGFARRGSGVREEVDLGSVVHDVVALMRGSASPGVVFECSVGELPLWALGDRSQIGQVLMNLCVNARDAVAGNGTIRVRASLAEISNPETHQLGNYVRLQVIDDGPGMDAATRQRAFEPFFTTKPRGEGTGLGLAMVYGVSRAHDGWTEIHSAPGRGTTVTVFLPYLEKVTHPAHNPQTISTSAMGAQLLVVDDDALVRNALSRSLGRLGYRVFTAADGDAALAQLRALAPDLEAVLLDLRMPGKDGFAVLGEIRRSWPNLPVILCSGFTDHAGSPLLELDELTDFLQKPVDPQMLAERLERLARLRDGNTPSGAYVRPGIATVPAEPLKAAQAS